MTRPEDAARCAGEVHGGVSTTNGIEPSMSRPGNGWDDAVTESFLGAAKRELTPHGSYATREEARRSSFESIGVSDNRRRLHPTPGHRGPAGYELRFAS